LIALKELSFCKTIKVNFEIINFVDLVYIHGSMVSVTREDGSTEKWKVMVNSTGQMELTIEENIKMI